MKKESDNTRTEEVQDIIDRMPTRWTTLIMAVTTAVILAAAALSVRLPWGSVVSVSSGCVSSVSVVGGAGRLSVADTSSSTGLAAGSAVSSASVSRMLSVVLV